MADTITLNNTGTVSSTTLPFNLGSSTVSTDNSPLGAAYNYTLVVQIPIPWLSLNLNLDLIGNFVRPTLTALGIPQAIQFLTDNAVGITNNIVNTAVKLIRAIPEASVTILVKVGPAIVLNVVLMAKKVPVVIPVPSFQLALPDLAVAVGFDLTIPFPAPPPIYIFVPIPVPIIAFPPALLSVTGGNVSATAGAAVKPTPVPISDPVYLPQI